MAGNVRRALVRNLLVSLMAPAVAGLCVPARAGGTGAPQADNTFYNTFEGMRLLDQDGQPFAPDRLLGQLVLVNFIFTACTSVCPVQTHALSQLQRQLPAALKARVQFVSVSLDPLGDTPATLKAFASRLGADTKSWAFVTGRRKDIDRLSDALWLFRAGRKSTSLQEHSNSIWLVDARGELRLRLGGSPLDLPRLKQELLALDAASGQPAGLQPSS